jgi:uncharacterized protein YlxP (DUF503 family)
VHAAALRLEIRLPDARSLKDKRRIIKGLMGSLGAAFPVALSEVGFHDQWQRATIGAALVAPQAGQLERIIHRVQHALRERPDIELLEVGIAYLEER